LMRPQTNRECGWIFSQQRAERVFVLLAVMRQLPKFQRPDRQSEAGRLAKHLLVIAKQFRTPQGVDEFPVLLDAVSARLRHANCGWVQSLTASVGKSSAKRQPRSPKNRDGLIACVVRMEREHVFAE